MAYEYVVISDKGEFDRVAVEEKVAALPATLRCQLRGEQFYVVAGDEHNLEFVSSLIMKDSETITDLAGIVTIDRCRVVISNPDYTDAISRSLRLVVEWLLKHYSCHLEDEFGKPVTIATAFGGGSSDGW